MGQQEKQLGQVKIAVGGTPEALYSPGASTTGIVTNIIVCEEAGVAATFSLYVDADGSAALAANTIFKDVALVANETIILQVNLPFDAATGTLSCEGSTTDVIFTASGLEIT